MRTYHPLGRRGRRPSILSLITETRHRTSMLNGFTCLLVRMPAILQQTPNEGRSARPVCLTKLSNLHKIIFFSVEATLLCLNYRSRAQSKATGVSLPRFLRQSPSTAATFGSTALFSVAFSDRSNVELAANPCVGGGVADLLYVELGAGPVRDLGSLTDTALHE